ncbi:MAG TPA: hypothetical protein VGI39_04425 [Polyangiaceae bacterium]
MLSFLAVLAVAGCGGPGRVQYDGGRCFKDGQPLTAQEVEREQAEVAGRIASRQPWFAVITIGVVLLAAAGNVDKVLLLARTRHAEGHRSFSERLREMLARQRERPAVFAAIMGGSLALVAIAGAAYIYLDVDKRASERALGMLQFCHLALRTKEEEGTLDEQRRNLEAIQSTAGDIRALVGRLPPDEQRKAQQIVEQMNAALDRQGRVVGEYAARTDEAQKDLSTHTLAMEKGLASMAGELAELKSLPTNLKELEGAAHRIDETTTGFDARLADIRARLAALDTKVDGLVARPVCSAAPPPPAKASTPPAPSPSSRPVPATPQAGDAGVGGH